MVVPVVPLAVVFGFLLLMLGIGVYHYFNTKWTGEYGYFLAGGDIGPIMGALTYMATLQSMFAFLGAIGAMFNLGLNYSSFIIGEALGVAVLMPTVGYKFWKLSHENDYVTPSDIVVDRFDGSLSIRVIIAVVMIMSMLIYLTVQFVGISLVLAGTTDGFISFDMGVFLMFLIGGIYLTIGGMDSVVITDAIQGILIVLGLSILLGIVFVNTNPLEMAQQGIAAKPMLSGVDAAIGSSSWLFWITQMLAIALSIFFWPQLWVRTYAVKSRKGLIAQSLALSLSTVLFFGIVGYFLALSAPTLLNNVSNPDQIAIMISENYLPSWLSALVLTGGAAASLSTLDSVALVLGSIASRDIYDEWLMRDSEVSDRRREWVSRLSGFLFMGIGALLVFGPRGIIVQLVLRFSFPGIVSIAPAVILGMYWKGATKNAAIASIVIAVGYLVGFLTGVLPSPLGLYHGAWTAAIAWIVMIVWSILEGKTAPQTIIDKYDLI